MQYSRYSVKTSIYRYIMPKIPGVFQVSRIPGVFQVFQVSGNPAVNWWTKNSFPGRFATLDF